jgi:hypothetical protein
MKLNLKLKFEIFSRNPGISRSPADSSLPELQVCTMQVAIIIVSLILRIFVTTNSYATEYSLTGSICQLCLARENLNNFKRYAFCLQKNAWLCTNPIYHNFLTFEINRNHHKHYSWASCSVIYGCQFMPLFNLWSNRLRGL